MKATKVKVIIEIEVLSIDSVQCVYMEAIKGIEREITEGSVRMDDGDQVKWKVTREEVEF